MYLTIIIVYYTVYKIHEGLNEQEPPKYFIVIINIVSAIIGLFWIYIVSSILIDLLTCFGILFSINSTYLGLTILALGNALPDALTVIAFSK